MCLIFVLLRVWLSMWLVVLMNGRFMWFFWLFGCLLISMIGVLMGLVFGIGCVVCFYSV